MLKKITEIIKIIKTIIRVIGAIFAIFLLINIISNFLSADEIAKEQQRAIADFKTIQHPENSKEISHIEERVRRPIYSVKYLYTLDQNGLEKYYDKELEKHGWKKEKRIKSDPPTTFSYVKGKSDISFSKVENEIWLIELRYWKYRNPV